METRSSFSALQKTLFFALLALATGAFLWLIGKYLTAIVWAVVLAVLFYPLHARLVHVFSGSAAAAALTTMAIAIIAVFIPISVLGGILARESLSLYALITEGGLSTTIAFIERLPGVGWVLAQSNLGGADIQAALASLLKATGSSLATGALGAGAHVASFAAKTLVMLYLLFFFLKDGTLLTARLMRSLPLGDEKEVFLYKRFSQTVRAIVKGSLIVALAQGIASALIFTVAGIGNPVLWGALVAFCALIPAVGPAIVWVPIGALSLLFGDIAGGIVVIAGGIIVVSTLDNLLRPILVGKDTGIHDALVLLSVLGGLSVFGLSGLILGPVIAALFLAMWELFEAEYKHDLLARG